MVVEGDRGKLQEHDVGGVRCILRIEGVDDGQSLGASACALADQDGDGRSDFAVGAFNVAANMPFLQLLPGTSPSSEGFFVVLRGDGHMIGSLLESDRDGDIGSQLTELGDLTGDGVQEWAFGTPTFSLRQLFWNSDKSCGFHIVDGATKVERWRVRGQLGLLVGSVGDVDADGIPDLGVALPQIKAKTCRFELRSGRTDAVLHEFEIEGGDIHSMTALDDVDGDGAPDFALGSRQIWIGEDRRGAVFVHSGLTGEPLSTFRASAKFENFGGSLLAVGDLDGDAIPELLVASNNFNGSQSFCGKVSCISIGKSETLFSVEGTWEGGEFGTSMTKVADIDGDGRDDVAISAWRAADRSDAAGRTTLFTLHRDGLRPVGDMPGGLVASIGDIDGDGHREFAAMSPAWPSNLTARGRVLVYSSR